jgi:LPXTG-site transpeptidase (sortase) family protein
MVVSGSNRYRLIVRRGGLALSLAVCLSVLSLSIIGCGGKSQKTSASGTPPSEATEAPASTPTPSQNAGLLTPIAMSPGGELTQADLAARGVGEPGRGDFAGDHLMIPKIGVDAPFSYKVVGSDGQMPNPDGPEDVAYYDFSQWPNLGGLPGKGGNVVVAGHVDYIRYGPAVFWRLHELEPGDMITVRMKDGTTFDYKIEFNKQVDPGGADWSKLVEATADESITLITCGGQFEAGHYNLRRIVWGRRV